MQGTPTDSSRVTQSQVAGDRGCKMDFWRSNFLIKCTSLKSRVFPQICTSDILKKRDINKSRKVVSFHHDEDDRKMMKEKSH